MALKVVFTVGDNDHGPYEVGSMASWERFADWVNSLPKTYWALKTLVMRGEWSDTLGLSEDLRAAMKDHPSFDADIDSVACALEESLGKGMRDETVMVLSS